MKMILAMIEPHKLPDVRQALYDVHVYNMTISTALGCGKNVRSSHTFRGISKEIYTAKKVRLEIGVTEDFLEPALDAIVNAAKADLERNHCTIFVYDLQECINVKGERGTSAIM